MRTVHLVFVFYCIVFLSLATSPNFHLFLPSKFPFHSLFFLYVSFPLVVFFYLYGQLPIHLLNAMRKKLEQETRTRNKKKIRKMRKLFHTLKQCWITYGKYTKEQTDRVKNGRNWGMKEIRDSASIGGVNYFPYFTQYT